LTARAAEEEREDPAGQDPVIHPRAKLGLSYQEEEEAVDLRSAAAVFF